MVCTAKLCTVYILLYIAHLYISPHHVFLLLCHQGHFKLVLSLRANLYSAGESVGNHTFRVPTICWRYSNSTKNSEVRCSLNFAQESHCFNSVLPLVSCVQETLHSLMQIPRMVTERSILSNECIPLFYAASCLPSTSPLRVTFIPTSAVSRPTL